MKYIILTSNKKKAIDYFKSRVKKSDYTILKIIN